MWSIPNPISSNHQTPLLPKHFILLVSLYVSTTVALLTWNSILPTPAQSHLELKPEIPKRTSRSILDRSQNLLESEPSQSTVKDTKQLQSNFFETFQEQPSLPADKKHFLTTNLDKSKSCNNGRSNSTKIRVSSKENRLFYHWISNMSSILDESADILWPWNCSSPGQVSKCNKLNIHFALASTFRPRALVSFPGSGSSWLRYLLERATGIFTGSVFNDSALYDAGLLGEFESITNGRTILQKTHHDAASGLRPSAAIKRRQARLTQISELVFGYHGVLLVRNPFDAIVSYWNYVNTKNHKSYFAPTPMFSDFARKGIRHWARLIETWVQKSPDLILVQYEYLVKNPRAELVRILEYLGVPVDNDRLNCTLESLEGPFHRKMLKMSQRKVGVRSTAGKSLIQEIEKRAGEADQLLKKYYLTPFKYNFENAGPEAKSYYA